MNRPLAVFFAKRPEPGQVKTRLCPPLDPLASAELYHRILLDLFHRFSRQKHNFQLGVAYSPKGGKEYFERITPAGTHLFLQQGNDLASRMVHFFQEAFEEGFGPVVIVGSDIPFLGVDRLDQAFELLASSCDVTIGPDRGGGYYLVGLRKFIPELFQGQEISARSMMKNIVAQTERNGLRLSLLPEEIDIDYPEDLLRLVENTVRHPHLTQEIPELIAFLKQLGYFLEISPKSV